MSFELALGLSGNDSYNPFLADVYSLGLLCLRMINVKWGKNDLRKGLLSTKDNFIGYEPIMDVLNGMLEEDPEKRLSFAKICEFFHLNEIMNNI